VLSVDEALKQNFGVLLSDLIPVVLPNIFIFCVEFYTILCFLYKILCFYCATLRIRGTSHGPVSVCPSVTSRSSTKTAERIELVFGM